MKINNNIDEIFFNIFKEISLKSMKQYKKSDLKTETLNKKDIKFKDVNKQNALKLISQKAYILQKRIN